MRRLLGLPANSKVQIEERDGGDHRIYRYRVEFTKSVLLQRFVFDPQDKLVAASQEDIEASSPQHSERPPSG
jgi:hypothetical protein